MSEPADTPTPACVVCHHPRHAWGVCDPCVARVDRQLADLLDLHALAQTTTALTRPTTGQTASASIGRAAPIPCHLPALDLAHGEWLLSTDEDPDSADPPWTGLEGWEQDWRATLGDTHNLAPYGTASADRLARSMTTMPIPGARRGHQATEPPGVGVSATPGETGASTGRTATSATLTGVIHFLRAWWPQAAQTHPAADEFAQDIHRMHTAATTALNLHPNRPWTVPCPATTEHGDCGYRLHIDYAGRDLHMHCPRCGSNWDIPRLLLVAASAGRGVWVTAAEAADHIGVHRATIHRAIQSGHITTRWQRVDLLTVHTWHTTARRTSA